MMAENEVNPFYAHLYPKAEPKPEVQIDKSTEDQKPRYLVGRGGAIKMTPEEYSGQLAAIGRGAVKGVVGGPGEFEKFVTRTVPGALGYQTPNYGLFGRETMLPTTSEVEKGMETIGLGKTPEKYKPTEQATEIVSGFLGIGPEAKLAKGTFETAAAMSPKTAISRLFGAPKTASEVGEPIAEKLFTRLQDLIATRRPQANKAFQKYFDAAKPFEDEIRNTYTQTFERFKSMFGRDLSKEELNIINDSLARLKGDKGIGVLEKERRRLDEIADGVYEGYGSVAQTRARQLADSLRKTIEDTLVKNTGSNAAKEAFDTYAELSKPINDFQRATGKKVTTRAGEFLPDVPKAGAEDLGGAFFKSKRSVEDLKTLSGDPAFAEQMARNQISSEFAKGRIKTADQVDAYIASNMDWLKQVPKVLEDLETLRGRLGRAQSAKFIGKLGAGGAAFGGGALTAKTIYDIFRGH